MLNLELAVVPGRGRMAIAGLPVPVIEASDGDRDPVTDYETADIVLMAWIRRAVHAERFATALEIALEAERRRGH